MIRYIIKRDGRKVPYDVTKISDAILMAATAVSDAVDENIKIADTTAKVVDEELQKDFNARKHPTVEQIQDYVESALISEGHALIAKEYILYRAERNKTRAMKANLMQVMEELTFKESKESDMKRENGNIDANTAMGTMLKYGSEASKEFTHLHLLDADVSEAHKSGDIHIHDLDFYPLTETCCQIDLYKLFDGGFNTGHGYLREPGSIRSAAALTAIALQSNQNEMHGGQSIPAMDYYLAHYVDRSYITHICEVLGDRYDVSEENQKLIKSDLKKLIVDKKKTHLLTKENKEKIFDVLKEYGIDEEKANIVLDKALNHTDKETYQAMEALVHNLNSMHFESKCLCGVTHAANLTNLEMRVSI